MKLAPLIAIASAAGVHAAIFSYDFSGINASIPDANASGVSNSQTVNDAGIVSEIQVTLGISGGSNGDLYVYLSHNDHISILMNRVGKSASLPGGYNDPGVQLTFADSAVNGDVHTYRQAIFGNDTTPLGGPLSNDIAGPFQPDGRAVSPFTVTTDSARTAKLSVFGGQQLTGTWTLFVADVATGDTSVLTGWTMQVTTVPEPRSAAIIGFALFGIALAFKAKRG
jgi:subtilisin-like proprotein convertase family protein